MVETVMCDKSLFSVSHLKERERETGGGERPNWTNPESEVMKINNRKFVANNTEIQKNLELKYL